jgi:molecular chaperone Hsp33
MNNNDILQRFIFEDAGVRGEIVRLNQSFKAIISQHRYPPLVQQLLGEMLAVAALLTATIKFKGRLTVQFQGKGKLKLLLAQCDYRFHIRGLAQWADELTQEELGSVFKDGTLAITIDPTGGGKRYQGIVSWEGNSIAQSVEGYFRHSEQLPSRIWLAVDKDRAVGLFLQTLPESELASRQAKGQDFPSEAGSDWEKIIHLTETVTPAELLLLENETLLRRLYSLENEVRIYAPAPVTFQCKCSRENCEQAILLLGQDEIEDELKDKNKIVVTCDFCSKEFMFDRVDLENIFKQRGDTSSSTQIH